MMQAVLEVMYSQKKRSLFKNPKAPGPELKAGGDLSAAGIVRRNKGGKSKRHCVSGYVK